MEELSDVAQIITLLDVLGNELYQRLSQRCMHRLDLLQKLGVHKERWSLHYASYRRWVQVRILISNSYCYRLNEMLLIENVSLTWLEL